MAEYNHKKNLEKLFHQKTLLDILIEVEKFLSFIEIDVYANWLDGEVVDGPNVSRYWVKLILEYDYKEMPDPMAARVLHDIGCIVNFTKSIKMVPVEVKGYEDFRPGTKKPKLEEKKVWHVELKIPRRFVDNVDYNELEELDDDIDVDDIEVAKDEGLSIDDTSVENQDVNSPIDQDTTTTEPEVF